MTPDGEPRVAAHLAQGGIRVGEQRRSPRTPIALPCTLRRPHGSPVAARTRDLGAAGMCASTSRPLTVDERLSFDLALSDDEHLAGEARVLREQDFGIYALSFEVVSSQARARLLEIVGASDPRAAVGM